ncbi:MAG TPA: N-6 DNA methylase [Stellaceae bacterium]|nr:N-6 DNA methylase [Stellaceae bacterium]
MVTETDTGKFREALRAIGGSSDPMNLAMTVGRMLAAARLDPPGVDGETRFCDENRELTKPDWLAMLGVLSKQWGREHRRGESPFDRPAERPPERPGTLEQLRRLVLSWLRSEDATTKVPDWVLQSTLELAQPRDFFAGSLDPEVRDLIDDMVGVVGKSGSFFCAYGFSAGVALHIAATRGVSITLDVEQDGLASLCTCLGLAAGLRLQVRHGDPIKLARSDLAASPLLPDISYDAAIVIPPFNMRRHESGDEALGTGLPALGSGETAGIILTVARAKRLGICLLPNSFLFKVTKADQIFKDRAIRDFNLETVIALPRGIFGGTSLPAAMVIFKPKSGSARKDGRVLMVDARGERDRQTGSRGRLPEGIGELLRTHEPTEISALVSLDEIAANDFNLSVERYVLEPAALRMRDLAAKATSVSLDDVAEFYRPQALPKALGPTLPKERFFEVGAANIDEVGLVRRPTKEVVVTAETIQHTRRARLERGDVLLVVKGSVGKVGFVRDVPDDDVWLASQSFVVLRLRRHGPLIDPRVLHRFLSSDLGRMTLQRLCVGITVPGLQMADVRRLQVMIPSIEEQNAIVRDVEALFDLQDRIEVMLEELGERQLRMWPDRHTEQNTDTRGSLGGEKKRSLPTRANRKNASQ